MSLYEKYVIPELIQFVCGRKQFVQQRQSILPHARGNVLEIGMGAGANLPFYAQDKVKHIFGLEPSYRLQEKARELGNSIDSEIEFINNGAEDIPLENNSVDTAVITFTMCSIMQIQQAMEETRRVLKADGQLLFCEHGLAPEASVQRWQNRLNPIWKKLAGGCHLNRDIPSIIEQAGFQIEEIDQEYMQGPRPFSYIFKGIAKRC